MKSIRILPLLLALVLLCTGCAAGGAAEPTPAPDMSDLPLDGAMPTCAWRCSRATRTRKRWK